ncbi:MAG TPA: hypothetical protein VMR52_07680 [Dehalococcoidia bacterium]|nr:hypothetical protein [Dehalococcoidia bacterium]
MAGPKFQLVAFPEVYALPGRPGSGSQAMKDAHRQTSFLLADDLALLERAMNSQLRIVAENAKAKGTHTAALLTLWSRTFSHLADAVASISVASYASAPLLLRGALDCIAVQRSLIADGFAEYETWYAGGIGKQGTALSVELGHYRAASVLAEDDRLGLLYRLLSALAMPHFGSTLLLTSPDSGENKIVAGFADSTFHLAWAEVTLGLALQLGAAQIETVRSTDVLALSDEAAADCDAVTRAVASALASSRRCYVEQQADRFTFHNFRRTATGQPRRIIL